MKTSFTLSPLRNKKNVFYILAAMPLSIIAYYVYVTGYTILSVFIPFYGFLILLLKKDKLVSSPAPVKLQQFVGLAAIVASFFFFFESIASYSFALYGVAAVFYTVYILGLFMAFFNFRELKETVSALFLIIAGGFSFYAAEGLEYFINPAVPYFLPFFVFVLSVLGISATIQSPRVLALNTSRGAVPVAFEAGCLGFSSFLVFSIIMVVTMIEEPAGKRTKLSWAIGGILGTFFINTIRVSLIAVVIYYFGYENWGEIHAVIGYVLFLLWLTIFFIIFSKREGIQNKIRALRNKL